MHCEVVRRRRGRRLPANLLTNRVISTLQRRFALHKAEIVSDGPRPIPAPQVGVAIQIRRGTCRGRGESEPGSLTGVKMVRSRFNCSDHGHWLAGQPDAVVTESYHVKWKTYQPELIVNRPEGVTIFDGAVDYIGVHDFFRFVEVTYVIDNQNNVAPLVIENIQPENLANLREVIIEPAGVIEIQPGESQAIKITFQVLTLEPYSFDLIWYHNGSNPAPYITGIMGDSNLNLGDTPVDSWLYRFIESLIRTGFFLKLPALGALLLRKKKYPQ